MKVFMTGGTGFVGRSLTRALARNGHEVTVLTRKIREGRSLPRGATFCQGDPSEPGAWQERAAGHEVFVNLAGTSIFKRWTDSVKKSIRDSRLLTTRNLVQALSARQGRETTLFSTSAIGYYGNRGDEKLDEDSASGTDFLAALSRDWEAAALEAETFGVRVVLTRFGIVLGRNGGALQKMLPPFRFCLGSPLGSGKQWFSWIHREDLARIYLYLLARSEAAGPVNCTAPNPVRNRELTENLGEALGRPTFLPAVPGFVIKLAMGEFGSVLLEGQRVLPKRLMDMNFRFEYPTLKEALEELVE
jgi:uncharacterized protein (TIGR01777 family)